MLTTLKHQRKEIAVRRTFFANACFVVAGLLMVLNPLPRESNAASAERERILDGAKKEGRLVLYTGMETDEASQFTKEFTRKYPFIKTDLFRSSGEKVQARFIVEQRAGTHLADVFQTSVVQVYQLKNAGMLARYVSEEAAALADGFKDPQGHWSAFYQIPYVIGYNTRLVAAKDVPTSYEDLLNPKWKGLISLETEEYQWFYHAIQLMGRDKGLDFMKKFARQDLQMRKGHTLLAQLVAAGESALATVVYSNRVERMKASGAPIDWVRFKGPTITAINAIAIPDKAPHPNTARLFVDFALSKEGQGLLRAQRRVPARADVSPDPPSLTQGLKLYPARPEGMIENYNETVARFDEIFNKGK
ncbi:MAG: extracellular solute-binding protein [Deltaproteobacteria bacterium]|nr:extracellular solute-binding protein [Deltaproteobacteria bacterium]